MNIEFEATFPDISIDEFISKLQNYGAKLIKPRTLYKRVTFNFPNHDPDKFQWVRVRDEGDVITTTIKEFLGQGIEAQKEIELIIDSFDSGVAYLKKLGCQEKAYQETYRQIWKLDNVHIMIDEWPYLEPFVEIEGSSEEEVAALSEKLGFNYEDALFGGVTDQYAHKYNVSHERINDNTARITFEDPNPFVS